MSRACRTHGRASLDPKVPEMPAEQAFEEGATIVWRNDYKRLLSRASEHGLVLGELEKEVMSILDGDTSEKRIRDFVDAAIAAT